MVLKIGTLDDPSAPDVSPNFEKRVVSGPHGSGGPAPRPNGGVGDPHGSGGPAPPGPTAVRQNISLALVGSIFRLTVPRVFCEIMICVFCLSGIRDCFESGGIVVCIGKRGRDN